MPNEELPLEVYWDDLRVMRGRSVEPEVTVPTFPDLADPNDLVIGTSRNRILAIIKPNGEVLFGPEYTPDEAATIFWESMGQRRLMMEERLLIIRHMEAILVRLGQADMESERIRRLAADEQDPIRKLELTQSANLAVRRLEMVAHQAIELGRGLVRRPGVEVPPVPGQVPESVRRNEASDYQGRAGLPDET